MTVLVAARLLGVDHAGLSTLALQAPSGARGLTLVPYLEGERTPNRPDATAALTGGPAKPATAPVNTRPQTTAAVSGLVTAVLALLIVAATFTVQLVYRDYYTCVSDSLTKSAQVACNDELPKSLVPVFGVKE